MRPFAPILLTAALALTACSATAAPVPDRTASQTPDPTPTATHTSIRQLMNLYVAAGGQCSTLTLRADSAVSEESGDCDGGALLSTYRSESQRDSAIAVLEGLQVTNPSPHVIAFGPDWIVNGSDAAAVADAMGGEARQIGTASAEAAAEFDLTTDEGLCAADAEMTNLELNDALAPLLGFPADRDARTPEQDEMIREHKNAAFLRVCPERAG